MYDMVTIGLGMFLVWEYCILIYILVKFVETPYLYFYDILYTQCYINQFAQEIIIL